MSLKLYEESSVQAIADAIRAKNESQDTYTIAEMADAIDDIVTGAPIEYKTYFKLPTSTINVVLGYAIQLDDVIEIKVNVTDTTNDSCILCTDRGGWDARLALNIYLHDSVWHICNQSTGVSIVSGTHIITVDLAEGKTYIDATLTSAQPTQSYSTGYYLNVGKLADLGVANHSLIEYISVTNDDDIVAEFKGAEFTPGTYTNKFVVETQTSRLISGFDVQNSAT